MSVVAVDDDVGDISVVDSLLWDMMKVRSRVPHGVDASASYYWEDHWWLWR